MLLNRLNPLKGLSDDERKELIAEFREQREAYGNRDVRLALMDDQGIDKALMYPASVHDIEFEFADDLEALYANVRAFNRWIHEEIGYAYQGRMFLPPYLALADVDLALAELETLLETGTPMVQFKSGHAHGGRDNPFGGRSIADPVFDPIWARINEAGLRVAVHLGATDYQKYGADWSEDPEVTFGGFDAFQWVMYWGDRPAMELTAGMILHNLFGRFPNVRVCLSEQGTVWLPYTLRKMDHAFLMGRKAKWGELTERPSEIFRRHFVVAPFPEENVERVVAEVGIEPIVFGSDFPHGEGLAYPVGVRRCAAEVVHRRREARHHARQPRALPARRLTVDVGSRPTAHSDLVGCPTDGGGLRRGRHCPRRAFKTRAAQPRTPRSGRRVPSSVRIASVCWPIRQPGATRPGVSENATGGPARRMGPNRGCSTSTTRPVSRSTGSVQVNSEWLASNASTHATPPARRCASHSDARRGSRTARRARRRARRRAPAAWPSVGEARVGGEVRATERLDQRAPTRLARRGEEHPAGLGAIQPVEGVQAVVLLVGDRRAGLALVAHEVVGVGRRVAADHRGRQELALAGAALVVQREEDRRQHGERGVGVAVDGARAAAAAPRPAPRSSSSVFVNSGSSQRPP